MNSKLSEIIVQYNPQERERLRRDWGVVIKEEADTDPDFVAEVLGEGESPVLSKVLNRMKQQNFNKTLANVTPEKLGDSVANLQTAELDKLTDRLTPEQKEFLAKKFSQGQQSKDS